MRCRRCLSPQLRQLSRASPQDHHVFRCLECSFIFSPPDLPDPLKAEKAPAAPAPQWPLSWEALARLLASQASRAEEV